MSRVWEPPQRCRDARKYDWAAGPGDRSAIRDRHIVGQCLGEGYASRARAHLACGKDIRRAQDHSARALREPNFGTTRTDFTRDLAEAGRACLNNLLGITCGQDYCGCICLELLQTHAHGAGTWMADVAQRAVRSGTGMRL